MRGGLIPACAGSTVTHASRCTSAAAHPRMRGEHVGCCGGLIYRSGSSPHARGALQPDGGGDHPEGLIPACAGSTGSGIMRAAPGPAHPRMRGEHAMRVSQPRIAKGSSPHARGAPDRVDRPRPHWRAHPRMRGEHASSVACRGCPYGSSPHARGARPQHIRVRGPVGLIPACAGSTPP